MKSPRFTGRFPEPRPDLQKHGLQSLCETFNNNLPKSSLIVMDKTELEPYEKLILSVKRKLEKKKDG